MHTHALLPGSHAFVMLQAGAPQVSVAPGTSYSPGGNFTGGALIPVVAARQTLKGYSPASFNVLIQQQVSAEKKGLV